MILKRNLSKPITNEGIYQFLKNHDLRLEGLTSKLQMFKESISIFIELLPQKIEKEGIYLYSLYES